MARQPPTEICLAAQAAQKVWKIPASASLSQWILESGWGAHSPGNNPFGMKPRHGMNDPCQQLMTKEFIHGEEIEEEQPFRIFPSVDAAFLAHAELLATAPVYADAMTELPDVDAFIDKMAPHYATAPNYAETLKGLIQSQGLFAYDD